MKQEGLKKFNSQFAGYVLPVVLFLLTSVNAQNWTKHIISDTLYGAKKNAPVNLDRDAGANFDIVVTANPESANPEDPAKANVIWFENTGNQVFVQHTIDLNHVGARGLATGDLTGNGYADILVGSRRADSSLVWYKNNGNPREGSWQKIHLGGAAPNNYMIRISDLDGDGLLDIIDGFGDDADSGAVGGGTFPDSLRWLKNLGGTDTACFSASLIASYSSPAGIAIADFDADGHSDVAAAAWVDYNSLTPVTDEDVRWWDGETFMQKEIIEQTYGANGLEAADLDGDGDSDLLAAGYKKSSLDWWENDGSGNFGPAQNIASSFDRARNITARDMDGDGDMDVAACADNNNEISWFENDGSQQFSKHVVSNNFAYAYFVSVFDLDGDGDEDLIGTAQDAAELAWWSSDLAEEKVIAAGDPDSAFFNDSTLAVDFGAGYSGGLTSSFFNHGKNGNADSLGLGVDHIASAGYFTIVCKAAAYNGELVFYYGKISEWQNVANDDNDLRVCYWDENSGSGEWLIAGNGLQLVDTLKKSITVQGIDSGLKKYSLFTLASVSTVSALRGTDSGRRRADRVSLYQNFPNPFNQSTKIRFNIPQKAASAELAIYDISGRLVKKLFKSGLPAGSYVYRWNGLDNFNKPLATGIYIVRLKADNMVSARRLHLIR